MNAHISGIIVVLTSLLGGCISNPALFQDKAERETTRAGSGLIEAVADAAACGAGALLEGAVLDAVSRGSRRSSYYRDYAAARSYQDCERKKDYERMRERMEYQSAQAERARHAPRTSCRAVWQNGQVVGETCDSTMNQPGYKNWPQQ